MPKWQVNVKRAPTNAGPAQDPGFTMEADAVTLDATGNLSIRQGGAIKSVGSGHWNAFEVTKIPGE